MFDSIRRLLSEDSFMPHGMCYLWQPGVLGLHVVSDTLITLAYFAISFTLAYFVHKRKDLQFHWMFISFAVFIVACSGTHLMEVWVIWHPTYWLSGAVKALTALASEFRAHRPCAARTRNWKGKSRSGRARNPPYAV
jgi:hypothetical protein